MPTVREYEDERELAQVTRDRKKETKQNIVKKDYREILNKQKEKRMNNLNRRQMQMKAMAKRAGMEKRPNPGNAQAGKFHDNATQGKMVGEKPNPIPLDSREWKGFPPGSGRQRNNPTPIPEMQRRGTTPKRDVLPEGLSRPTNNNMVNTRKPGGRFDPYAKSRAASQTSYETGYQKHIASLKKGKFGAYKNI